MIREVINVKDSNNLGCKFDPLQLALIGALFNLIGDFLGFLGAFQEIQSSNGGDNCKQQNSINSKKYYAENRIKEIEYELYMLKKELDNLDE